MKSITIHGIDIELDTKISEKSAEYGLSQNRTVKYILHNALLNEDKSEKRDSFMELFGKWNESDKKEFDERIKDFELINEMDWK